MPDTFVVNDFIEHLDQKEKEFSSMSNYVDRNSIKKKIDILNRVLNFLLASNINTDLSEKDIVKFYKKVSANKNYMSLKEHIYFNAVKNQRLTCYEEIFENSFINKEFCFKVFLSQVNKQSGVYFIPCDSGKCEELKEELGLIVIGTDFCFDDFYEDKKIVGKVISKEMNGIEVCQHPCNSMIIVDPYIFKPGKGRVDKTPNIIRMIKAFMSEKLSVKFHLLILTEDPINYHLDYLDYQSKINKILQELGGPEKILIEVYTSTTMHFDDRIILTNYANINIGHPYDRDTYLNCVIFFADTDEINIRNNYSEYLKLHNLIKNNIQKNIFRTAENETNRLFSY